MPGNQFSMEHPDDIAIDEFAAVMKAKMKFAREVKGRGGWNEDICSVEDLSKMLRGHLDKPNGYLMGGDPVDVANFCMMLFARGSRIVGGDNLPRETLRVVYKNWKGEVSVRNFIPEKLWFGATEFHTDPQWLITGFDLDKMASRDFALRDIQGAGE